MERRRPRPGAELPDSAPAPDFVDPGEWFNTGGEPLSIAELTEDEGRVVLIDFWTYTCINCIRTLPYLRPGTSEYRDDGLTIVGVHAPEFAFETRRRERRRRDRRERDRVPGRPGQRARHLERVREPVLAGEVPDRRRRARFATTHFGEGDYEQTEAAIRSLLAEAGDGAAARGRGPRRRPRRPIRGCGRRRPTSAPSARRAGSNGRVTRASSDYAAPDRSLAPNQFAYGGRWRIDAESATAVARRRRSTSVQGPARLPRPRRRGRAGRASASLLDGEPIAAGDAGEDVAAGVATIDEQRLYRLVDLPEAGEHTLTLRFEPGIAGYAFTFG